MTTPLARDAARPLPLDLETLLRATLFLMLSIGSVSFFEPSPYEIVFLCLVPLVVFGHFVMTRVTLLLFGLVIGFLLMENLALMPWLNDRPTETVDGPGSTATVFTLQTVYLFLSALIFAVIFTRHTAERLRLALVAYTISSIFAAGWAAAGWLGVPGFHDTAMIVNRVAGPFKDPNVLGSYSVLGALCLMQAALDGRRAWRWPALAGLGLVMFGGVFLPLSRGAWGAMVFAALYWAITTFATSADRRTRRRMLVGAALLAALGAMATIGILSDPDLRDIVTSRAKLEQDYDSGTTGRFGNQLRAIPMLLERPLGFGPHRFSFIFDLDPHNSYVGAFASAGWLGGLFFLLLVAITALLAIRLSLVPSPFRRQAQTVAPALLSAFLQAFQIDIDHWRFIYLMVGAVWGMEAARVALRAAPLSLNRVRKSSDPVNLAATPSA